MTNELTRRRILKMGLVGSTGLVGAGLMAQPLLGQDATPSPTNADSDSDAHSGHDGVSEMLMDWDYGTTSPKEDGGTLREYQVDAGDIEIEIAPGLFFPAWAYNARVPGPTLRCTEGDQLKVHFANYGTHNHTMHFHGFHTS